MSRSTTHPMPRESVWPSAPPSSSYLASLEDCITATENCVASLSATVERLQPGIQDLPRLTKVLSNAHLFLVLPQTTIHTHLAALSTTLAPQIDTLMSRAEHLVEIERSRISSMEETVRILQKGPSLAPGPGRNQHQNQSQETDEDDAEKEGAGWGDKLSGVEMDGMTVVQRRKVTMLRNKRERMLKAFAEAGVVVPGHDI